MKNGPSWIEDFSGGVVQHLPPTKLPVTVSPRAWNTALRAVQGGSLLVTKRPGFQVSVTTTGSANSTIVAAATFNYETGGTITTYLIGVDSDGLVWNLTPGSVAQLTVPTGTYGFAHAYLENFSGGIQFVQANNQLFGWIRGGLPFKIYRKPNDSTLYVGPVGLPVPAAPTHNTTIAGVLWGTLDIRCTYYNSSSGVESSASSTLTLSISQVNAGTIRINLPTTGPAEVDKLRVYLRKQELQSQYTRDTSMEVALGTSTLDLNFTDAQLNQHLLLSPSTTEYGSPPASVICAWWHLSRMFVSDGKFLYYSAVGNGDQFNPANVENPGRGDGQRLAALRSLNDQTLALIKERSIWGLIGSSPQNWQLQQLDNTFGTISTLSVCEGDGLLGFWSENGPVVWDKASPPVLLVHETLAPLAQSGLLYLNRRDKAKGVFDPIGHRFLWTLDVQSASTPWTVAPWSTRYRSWEAIAWDLGPIQAFTVHPSQSAELRVFFGGVKRTLNELAVTYRTDGVTEATPSWRTVVSGTTAEIVLSSGSPTVHAVQSVARLISRTTLAVHRSTYTLVGTTLTWTTASSWTPAAGDLVLFDCPVAEYDTPAIQEGAPSQRHRLLQTYLEAWSNADVSLLLGLFRDNEQTPLRTWSTAVARNNYVTTGPNAAINGAVIRHKRWAGFLCLLHRFRVVLWDPGAEHGLSRIGWTTDIQGDEDS